MFQRIAMKSAILAIAFAMSLAAHAAADELKTVSVPPGNLGKALRTLADQVGAEFVYQSDQVRGLHTGGVSGDYSARDAVIKLLEGTSLQLWTDEESGALLIRHRSQSEASQSSGKPAESTSSAAFPATGSNAVAQASSGNAVADNVRSDEDSREAANRVELNEIVVVGTNIRGVAPTGSPVQVYNRDAIEQLGVGSVEEVLARIPANFASESSSNAAAGNPLNGEGFTAVNLRGIGTQGTLVLLNGHRLAPAALGNFVDIGSIPVGAIDRIEVLTDGASAIYGGDAIAGVVNIVLRDDYEGFEARLRGSTANGDADSFDALLSAGNSWDRGNALLSVGYTSEDMLMSSERSLSTGLPGPNGLTPDREVLSLLGTLRYDFSDRMMANLEGTYSESDINQLFAGPFFPPSSASSTPKQYSVNAMLSAWIKNDWKLAVSAGDASFDDERSVNFAGFEFDTDEDSEVTTAEIKADGPVIELPAGDVRTALGLAYRSEDYSRFDSSLADLGFDLDRFKRDVSAAYLEVNMPLAPPVSVSLAGRYESYSDEGDTFNPKAGIKWSSSDDVDLRATWGTSFNTARFSQTFTQYNALVIQEIASPVCPDGTCLVLRELGSRGEFEPETAETMTLGFDIHPSGLPGFSTSITYYRIEYEDRIGLPPDPTDLLANQAEFGDLVLQDPSLSFVNNFLARCAANPIVCIDLVGPIDPSSVEYFLDGRLTNLARSDTNGFDVVISYKWKTARAEWFVNFTGTHALEFSSKAVSTAPEIDAINGLSLPADTRVRLGFGAQTGALSISSFANYTNGYSNNQVIPAERIDEWLTVDLTAVYEFGKNVGNDSFSVLLGVQNLFDEDPPSATDPLRAIGFDAVNANPFGRVIAVQLMKQW